MQLNSEEKDHFEYAVRLSSEQILGEHELVSSDKFFTEIFGSIPGIAAVLNRYRQIVYVNDDFLEMLGLDGIHSLLGNRTGEVLSCVHAKNKTGGCGTAEACQFCGAHKAITESLGSGKKVSMEALITTRLQGRYKSLDLRVITTPVSLSGHKFLLLVVQDISSEKRRLALEKIFFHDLLNSAGGLNGLLGLLKDGKTPAIERKLIELSEEASRDIIDEIQLQRQIYAAETGDLEVKLEKINSVRIIQSAIGKIGSHESGRKKKIVMAENTADTDLDSDVGILQRVLMNLLKNALEATPPGGSVMIGAEDLGEQVRFIVKNEMLIPKDVQLQLFQRSFSTKGMGRGLGTYSIRLLTENYLCGTVSFISNETERTIFMIDLPKEFPV
ncbi:MAG TPA: ATP-binding protein [Bacteroidales bacterium]|jgi:signal transduction histidine kinase|nr:ATP-binding protein [Bacteroidales bacterium]